MMNRTNWLLSGALFMCLLVSAPACDSDGELSTKKDCEVVTCAENAVCVDGDEANPMPPRCECVAGFQGDPQACEDVDECALGTHDCDAACVNTSGSFTCAIAATCAELQAADPSVRDGNQVLYVSGDLDQPWAVYCHDMAGEPREYLPLVRRGLTSNFSQYEATTDGRTGQDIHTRFSHVRIDPLSFAIDVTDRLFAESTGSVIYEQQAVQALPFGVAMSCDRFDAGLANVDLTGTPFTLTNGFCPGGFGADSDIVVSPDNRTVDMSVVGGCGWVRADDTCADNPLGAASSALTLLYANYTRRVFVSSETVPSDFGGALAADAKCQELADNAGLGGEFVAWLGSSQGHPAERLVQHQVRYLLVDGTLVAENWWDLTDSMLRHPIDLTEMGTAPTGDTLDCNELEDTAVWTGTDANGEDFGIDWACSDWSGTGERVGVGSYDRIGRGWTDACRIQAPGGDPCAGQSAHLYCFEK